MRSVSSQYRQSEICLLAYTQQGLESEWGAPVSIDYEYHKLPQDIKQEDFLEILTKTQASVVLVVDAVRCPASSWKGIVNSYLKSEPGQKIGYASERDPKLWAKLILPCFRQASSAVLSSPFLIGPKTFFLKAYAGNDLAPLGQALGYSLQKIGGVKFQRLACSVSAQVVPHKISYWKMWTKYTWQLPFLYLFSGAFFRQFLQPAGRVKRDMVARMLIWLFACFMFIYMPYISKDYGISGDEYPDHTHTGYVLKYFTEGDPAALYQPKTTLHLYGISMQVIAGALCKWFHIEDYYEFRHIICAFNGALGILFVGLMGLRWGGGLCGLLSLLLMFFTPRFFGHSMNNLKDIPFATGYIISLYYTIRLFDYYPRFRLRDMIGLTLGIALALGTRSGGLILYPMLLMYAGLFYIQHYGIRNFYKIGKQTTAIGNILTVLLIVGLASYLWAIALWPFALQKPFTNVLVSLKQFTNYSIGLRTIFDGEQMMSNMLPWKYAPKYFLIAMPVVSLVGFLGYLIYLLVKRKEFTLISYFLLFATIFPIFWVIYKNSNLYGGIRHLLFVMPPLVVLAARFWQLLLDQVRKQGVKWIVIVCLLTGVSLPVVHMIKNHPNDYVYFNELVGGLKGAYANYETDYYYNSLKAASDWFKENVKLPEDRKTIIVTNHYRILEYYFRHYPNVKIEYSRYYEKYSKDWDYAMFANVYINEHQLKTGLFPPEGTVYAPTVDGFPMTAVIERQGKEELKGFKLEKEKKYDEALAHFLCYIEKHPKNEEVMSRIVKLSYLTNNLAQAETYGKKALELHSAFNETLYILTLTYIEENKLQEAMVTAQAMLDENMYSVDGLYLKALVYSKMRKDKEAVDYLNKTLSIRPNYTNALSLAGEILFRNTNYAGAANVYNTLLKLKHDLSDLVRLADCYCRLKQFKTVEQLLVKADEVRTGFLPAEKVRLRMMILQKDWNRAAKTLTTLAEVQQDAELWVLRGLYEYSNQRQGEALTMIDKALGLEPENQEALRLKQVWQKTMK